MAGSHEANPNTETANISKKSKSKFGKSGQVHTSSGKSGQSQEQPEQSEHTVQHQQEHSGKSKQNVEIATASKSKSGKSRKQHKHSGQTQEQQEQPGHSEQLDEQSRRKGKKRVKFSEEPSSKRQRVEEDDPLVYRDGPLEAVSSKFETLKPYFNTGMFIDLAKIDELGFPHLRPYLEKYMPWLGINQDYNINVLWVSHWEG